MPTEVNTAPVSDTMTVALSPEVEAAIEASLPHAWSNGPNEHDQPEFQLARHLKAIGALADAPATALRPYVKLWHQRARKVMEGKSFENSRLAFTRAWNNVKFPAGHSPMEKAFARARCTAPPPETADYEADGLKLLAALCRELQIVAGNGSFFLGCRTAGQLLKVDHVTAWRWLGILKMDGLIRQTGAGTKYKAARYVYGGTRLSVESSLDDLL